MSSPSDNLLICTACGTQFDTSSPSLLTRCNICNDPRQFVPKTGQSFTTQSQLLSLGHVNKREALDDSQNFWSIWTEPKIGIGQRAVFIKTPVGNVLWDCITFIDEETTEWIKSEGGLGAIVISHPHYYTTHLKWAKVFDCPVHLSVEDKEWLNQEDKLNSRIFIKKDEYEINIAGQKTGLIALKLGGHFPGSLVLLSTFTGRLFIADTLVTTPSGLGDWSQGIGGGKEARPKGMNSYAFMWSIPNMIPLSAEDIIGMWNVLKKNEFKSTHGAFIGSDVYDGKNGERSGVKERVLGSMQIQVQRMGWEGHAFLEEK